MPSEMPIMQDDLADVLLVRRALLEALCALREARLQARQEAARLLREAE